jgi:hypothetical protein
VGKSLSPYLLPGNPTLALHAATKQYVDAVSIAWVGNVSGNWVPDPTMAKQLKAVATAALTIMAPTVGLVDGYYFTIPLSASGATQTITIDGGISLMAGWPTSFQLPVNKRALVLLRYDGDFARWMCLSQAQEQ